VAALGALALAALGTYAGWTRGAAAGRAEAARDPLDAFPLCADAAREWVDRVERGPRETVAGTLHDVDGDGTIDVLFTNTYSESVSIWWGRRGGLPTERTDVQVGRSVEAPAVADVDGDGHLDLVVALHNDARLGIVPGRGERSFGAVSRIFQDPPPARVVADDIDEDGHPDLVFTSTVEAQVYLRRGGAGPDEMFHGQLKLFATDPQRMNLRVLPVDGALEAWFFGAQALVRRRIGEVGLIGDPVTRDVGANVKDLLVDHTSPSSVVARVAGSEQDGFVRMAAAQPVCLLGRIARHEPTGAIADLDGDGVVDHVQWRTCQFCESNHVFRRGEAR
jgi:hypothetical protein